MDDQNKGDLINKSDVQALVADAPFPCSKEQLINHATQNGAAEEELDMLEELPEVTYNSWEDVDAALGEPEEE